MEKLFPPIAQPLKLITTVVIRLVSNKDGMEMDFIGQPLNCTNEKTQKETGERRVIAGRPDSAKRTLSVGGDRNLIRRKGGRFPA